MVVQRKWMYLESIFIGGDIRAQLPEEAKKFDDIDKTFKKVCNLYYSDKAYSSKKSSLMKDIGNWRKNKSSWLLVVVLYCIQGCHWSGNSRGKKFFKVRGKSGNFILSQGKLIFWRNVRENWWVHVERTAVSSRKKPRSAVCIFQGNAIFIGESQGILKSDVCGNHDASWLYLLH